MERTFIAFVVAFSLVMGVLVAVLGLESLDGPGHLLVPLSLAFTATGFLGVAVASMHRKQAAKISELESRLAGSVE